MTTPDQAVLIIGGGFSGTMLAARLAENGRASVVIEATNTLAKGVAYGTRDDSHRLNVPASNMGALAHDPKHFLEWLHQHHPEKADGDAFVSRRLYGQYLGQRFAHAQASHPDLIATVRGTAVAIEGHTVMLDDGRRLEGRQIVIATGNPSPRPLDGSSDVRIIDNPWADEALDRIGAHDNIFVLGTSLTMADVVLGLAHAGWQGKAIALSRRGLMPRPHIQGHPPAPQMAPEAISGPLSRRLHAARQMAREMPWQWVMNGYRPITGRLWLEASHAQRSRFLRHLRPWWDAHRHRIAPDAYETLLSLQAQDRLQVLAGRLNDIEPGKQGLDIRWHPSARSDTSLDHARCQWFINCTGPAHDAFSSPLTAGLVEQGRARLEPLEQGLDLDSQGRLVHADGSSDDTIFVLGPPSRAAYWESTAVPDIRQKIEALLPLLTA